MSFVSSLLHLEIRKNQGHWRRAAQSFAMENGHRNSGFSHEKW